MVNARSGEVDLATKIGKIDSELSDKANQITDLEVGINSIGVTQIDKNKGKFDQTYMTDEFIEQMAGTTPVNAIPADESITTSKLAFLAVQGVASKKFI